MRTRLAVMPTPDPDEPFTSQRWVSVDMTMHAITVAMHLAELAGLSSVCAQLAAAWAAAQRERDRG